MDILIPSHSLTPKEYFKIIAIHYFRRRWWLYIVWAGMLVYSIHLILYGNPNEPMSTFRIWVPLFLLSLPALYIYNFYRFTHHSMNELHYLPRTIRVTDKEIILTRKSRKPDSITWDKIGGFRSGKKYFFLYITSVQFIPLPQELFESHDQKNLLQKFVRSKKIKKM
ncbi:MAG: YcxB family protein [Leptospirales bacterium]